MLCLPKNKERPFSVPNHLLQDALQEYYGSKIYRESVPAPMAHTQPYHSGLDSRCNECQHPLESTQHISPIT